MKKPATLFSHQIIYAVVAGMFFLSLLAFGVVAFAQSSERIDLFKTDIEVAKDGSFKVTERITYTFPADRHGMYRCIPLIHAEKPSSILKERYIDISVDSVEVDGAHTQYTLDRKNEDMCIKIGDPETTIVGTHEYMIQYTVAGAISYTTYGGAELYWNVTGNDWEVPISVVQVSVASPDGLLLPERACYQGIVGEIGSCTIKTTDEGMVLFSGTQFDPHEGLTIAQGLNRLNIPYDVRERFSPFLLWGGVTVLVGLIGGILMYRYKTKFKDNAPIIAQYEPYPGVRPMYTGLLMDGRLDPRDIAACIVDLAEQGFLKIKRKEETKLIFFNTDDYQITLVKPLDETVGHFERKVLGLIFKRFLMTESHVPAHESILNATVSYHTQDQSTSQVIFTGGIEPDSWPVGSKVWLSQLEKDYSHRMQNSQLIKKLKNDLEADLKMAGFFQVYIPTQYVLYIEMFLIGIMYVTYVGEFQGGKVFSIGIVILMVVVAFMYRRRTKMGYEALNHLKGFKNFLSVTESERYIFHNAPKLNAEHFMKYLPYAIAFGVEKQWAKTFEGIMMSDPVWYEGGIGAHAFNVSALSQGLGGFSKAIATSSGASASSGGGHSGGGSGGGGGGSW